MNTSDSNSQTTPSPLLRDILTEGLASQLRRGEATPGPLTLWHLITEAERNHWRLKAIKHLEQMGWS